MNPRLEEVSEWLQKAEKDLLSARILLEHDPPVLETACFHCQQAVEKALKAYLVWKGVPFERVHSLPYLLDLCRSRSRRKPLPLWSISGTSHWRLYQFRIEV